MKQLSFRDESHETIIIVINCGNPQSCRDSNSSMGCYNTRLLVGVVAVLLVVKFHSIEALPLTFITAGISGHFNHAGLSNRHCDASITACAVNHEVWINEIYLIMFIVHQCTRLNSVELLTLLNNYSLSGWVIRVERTSNQFFRTMWWTSCYITLTPCSHWQRLPRLENLGAGGHHRHAALSRPPVRAFVNHCQSVNANVLSFTMSEHCCYRLVQD